MISISVVKVLVKDTNYLLARHDLTQIRELLHSVRDESKKVTQSQLDEVFQVVHKLESGVSYKLSLDSVNLNPGPFFIYSKRHVLNQREIEHMSKLVRCAITAPNTLLVFPDYIVVSNDPPPPAEPTKRKRAPRKDKKNDSPR
jgi:hypothetical protein